eukprot:7165017-Lingulodinium_polyedra.AAC.1
MFEAAVVELVAGEAAGGRRVDGDVASVSTLGRPQRATIARLFARGAGYRLRGVGGSSASLPDAPPPPFYNERVCRARASVRSF